MPKAENKSWSSLHLPPSHGILNLMNRHQFFSNRTSPQELRSLPHLICIRRTLGLVLEKLSRFFPLVKSTTVAKGKKKQHWRVVIYFIDAIVASVW
jgi:hypothetical protein